MADFTQALFRIDPTEGLVDYVSTVKPYHSKLMEVLVEYVYTEKIDATVGERWKWEMTFSEYGANTDVLYSCGYGYRWDAHGLSSPEAVPTSLIVSATGKFYIDVSTTVGSANVAIVRNTTGHTLAVGDPIVFESDPSIPLGIEGGKTYFVTAVTPNLQVSETPGGTPKVFIDSVVTKIMPQGLPYNTFLVQPSLNTSSYPCLVTSGVSNQLTFVDSYDLTGVDTVTDKWNFRVGTWVSGTGYAASTTTSVTLLWNGVGAAPGAGVDATANVVTDSTGTIVDVYITNPGTRTYSVGHILVNPAMFPGFEFTVTIPALTLPLVEDDVIHINGNTSPIANGKYTVDNVVGSVVQVKENIPPLTDATGTMYVGQQFDVIPYWPSGTKVKVSALGDMPSPLSSAGTYYFIPSTTVGIFNLATKRYPLEIDDFIDIKTIGNQLLIQRVEPFSPGDYVSVHSTHQYLNDGNYIISTVEPEGSNFRVGVLQSVPSTTPQPLPSSDGVMTLQTGAYDMPQYCPAVKTPGLYASTFIHENLQFTFTIDEHDFIGSTVSENQYGGWGYGSYGSPTPVFGGSENFYPYTAITGGIVGSPTNTILPTGYDLQLFDVGPMDETLSVSQHMQNSYPAP